MILTINDNFRSFKAVINGVQCYGKIHIVSSRVYLCQNQVSGCDYYILEPYKYSWSIGLLNIDEALYQFMFVEESGEEINKYIIYSRSFRQFLENTRDKSIVSQMLYDYIDTTKENINYITNRTKGVSFLPAGKTHKVSASGEWSREGRQEGKPAKVVRKLFTKEGLAKLSAKDFEIFANLYKASNDEDGVFHIVKGEDIRKWYHEDMYADYCGSLSSSCMRYKSCQEFLDIYCKNSQVSMLILVKDEKLLARAIIWHYEKFPILDRVYGSDHHIVRFHEWAEDNDYCYRKENGNIIYQCSEITDTIDIKLDRTEFDYYPYVDTFRYLYDGYVSNDWSKGYIQELDNQNGGSHNTRCDNCDSRITEDDSHYCSSTDQTLCDDCAGWCNHRETTIPINREITCDWSNNTYHRDYIVTTFEGDSVYSEHEDLIFCDDIDGYTDVDHTFTCEYDGERYHVSNKITIEVDGETYAIYEDNEQSWRSDNLFTCEHDGEEHHIDNQSTATVNGNDYQLWDDNYEDWMAENVVKCAVDNEEYLKSDCECFGEDWVYTENIESYNQSKLEHV